MLSRFALRFSGLLQRLGRWNLLLKILIFLIIFLPLGLMVYHNYRDNQADAKALILSRRASITHLAATLIGDKFDHIIDLGVALTAQDDLQQHLLAGDWDEAISDLAGSQEHLDYIDNAVLFDVDGTLKSAWPPIPEVVGKNFSYRDYYVGVTKNWQPYVSEVFKRAAEPHYNVVVVAVPIFPNEDSSQQVKAIGILVMTIKLDTILAWAEEVDVGPDGFIYITDQYGNVAGHPKYSLADSVVNFANVAEVDKALRGESGVDITFNQIEGEDVVAGYEQVAKYGWVAVAQQPADSAYAPIKASLNQALVTDIILGSLSAMLLFFLVHLLFTIQTYYQKERILLESIGDGLIGIDRSWNITLWNKAAVSLTGWTKEEALGKPFRDIVKFINETTKEEDIRFIEETMLFGEIKFMAERTALRQKSGNEIAVGDSASPVYNENGVINGAIIIFRDISKDREIEKARDEFSSLATHQLRGPITTINAYVDLLVGSSLTPDQKEEVSAIEHASQSLNELVNAMLNVSRVESGSINIAPEPTYLPDILDGLTKQASAELASKKLILQKTYADGIPPINADKKLLEVISNNLLSNAIKYTPEGGSITVDVKKDEGNIILTVSDTGMGISPNDQAKIFTKFFRGDNAREAGINGTGLGLHMIKAILKQAGGNIWFESKLGFGSSFHVSVPLSGMNAKAGLKGLT